MKFGVTLQILVLRMVIGKVSKFCKFKITDGRHIENRFWLYLNDCTIKAKFDMKKQNYVQIQVT